MNVPLSETMAKLRELHTKYETGGFSVFADMRSVMDSLPLLLDALNHPTPLERELAEALETVAEWLNAVPEGRYGAIGELNRRKVNTALTTYRTKLEAGREA